MIIKDWSLKFSTGSLQRMPTPNESPTTKLPESEVKLTVAGVMSRITETELLPEATFPAVSATGKTVTFTWPSQEMPGKASRYWPSEALVRVRTGSERVTPVPDLSWMFCKVNSGTRSPNVMSNVKLLLLE